MNMSELPIRGYVADDGSIWKHDSQLHGAGAAYIREPLVSLRDAEREVAQRDQRIAEMERELGGVSKALAYWNPVTESKKASVCVSETVAQVQKLALDTYIEWQRKVELARAEVPEWCKPFVAAVYRAANSDGESVGGIEADELLDGVSKDQLRACGIGVE